MFRNPNIDILTSRSVTIHSRIARSCSLKATETSNIPNRLTLSVPKTNTVLFTYDEEWPATLFGQIRRCYSLVLCFALKKRFFCRNQKPNEFVGNSIRFRLFERFAIIFRNVREKKTFANRIEFVFKLSRLATMYECFYVPNYRFFIL